MEHFEAKAKCLYYCYLSLPHTDEQLCLLYCAYPYIQTHFMSLCQYYAHTHKNSLYV
jgi:hypothetical protein